MVARCFADSMNGLTCLFFSLCLVLGVLNVLYFFSRLFWKNLKKTIRNSRKLSSYGQYCIITGCTDGIGKALTLKLAQCGMSLILIARDKKKLSAIAHECREIIKRESSGKDEPKVETFLIDFSDKSDDVFKELEDKVKDLDIGILINNAGISYPHAMYFHEVSNDLIDDLVMVNIRSALRLVKIVYKGMFERKRGAIVCVGSGASMLPCEPLYSAYVATKGGLESFCRCLQAECREQNIVVQCHVPLLVATKMSKIRHSSLMVYSPEHYAEIALREIRRGCPCDSGTICPGIIHSIIIYIANSIPICLWRLIRLSQTKSLRIRAQKKAN